MRPRNIAQESTYLRKLVAALRKRLGAFLGFASIELGSVIRRYAVNYEQPNVLLLDCYWDLVAEYMLLRFNIVNVSALNAG